MKLSEILKENKLDPLYFSVDRKTRQITNFYGKFDPSMSMDARRKYEDAVSADAKEDILSRNDEMHNYYRSHHGDLKIGDRVDTKGNKIKPKPENQNLIQDLLQEYAMEKFGFEDADEAGDALDVYHENFVTPSGVPVYFISYDLDTIYAGKLPGNKITPVVDISSDGEGAEETTQQWNGAIYRIEQSAQQQASSPIPTLYKIVGDRSSEDRAGWVKVAQNEDKDVLMGLLLDIVWKRINPTKVGK